MGGNKVIEYVIAAKDRTADAIRSAVGRLKTFAASVGTNLMNVKAGFDMLAGTARTFAGVFAKAIGEAFKFEKATADFKTLLKSADAAKEHIAELKRFAASTPLTFDDLSRASKLILSFGGDVETIMPTLKTLGDISMGDAQKFQGLALVFAQVQSAGKLMGQDLLQMINQGFNPLTVIAEKTGRSMGELKEMMSEGKISFEMVAEAMRVATGEGGLFEGAMEEAAKTGQGLVSTLQDNWTESVRQFGEAFSGAAKGGIQELIDKLDELNKSGAIDYWATRCVSAIESVADGATPVISYLVDFATSAAGKILAPFRAVFESVANFGANLALGNGIGEAVKSLGTGFVHGWTEAAYGEDAAVEAAQAMASAKAAKEKAAAEEKAAKAKKEQAKADRESAPAKDLSAMLEEAERAENGKKAEEEAKKAAKEEEEYWKEYEKWAEAAAREEEEERIEAERKIAAERQRLWDEAMDERRRDLAEAQEAESEAQAALSEAQAQTRQAWGWYRDKDSLKAQIAEEKAEAQAQKDFAKEFDRLKRRRSDWRTADNLSLDDEAVRRVGVARENEAAAEKYAQETAEAAQRAADALEQMVQDIEQGEAE